MTWEGWYTLCVVVAMVYGLARNWAADVVTLGCLALVMVATPFSQSKKLSTVDQLVAGFGNNAMLTVAVLFVVVAGLVQTGAMTMITRPIIGHPKSVAAAQARLLFPVMGLSTFLNNTPC